MTLIKGNIFNIIIGVFKTCPVPASMYSVSALIKGCILPIRAFLLAGFIDRVLENSIGLLYLFLLISLFFLDSLLQSIQQITEFRMSQRIKREVINSLQSKFNTIQYQYIEDSSFQDLLERVKDNPQEYFLGTFRASISFISNMLRLVGIFILLFQSGWFVGLMLISISIPIYLVSMKVGKNLHSFREENNKLKRRFQYLETILIDRTFAAERILFGYRDYFIGKWSDTRDDYNKKHIKSKFKSELKHQTTNISTLVFEVAIYLLLLKPLTLGIVTLGYVVAVSNSLKNMNFFFRAVGRNLIDISKNSNFVKDVVEFHKLDDMDNSCETELLEDDFFNEINTIEFKSVSFRYPSSKDYVINNISFKLEGTKHYALVGKNGSGKSTIIKLLLRLYEPDSGEILINGININTIPYKEYTKLFSNIFQNFAKYNISLRDNLTIGNSEEYSEDDLSKALGRAGFNKTMELDRNLGKVRDESVELSGGEWQKLIIARTLLSPSRVLVLDEPTSALDPLSEVEIYNQYYDLLTRKLTLFVTHRLGSIKLCDEILVLESGSLLEKGSHKELMSSGSLYSEMYHSQRGWYE